MKESKVWKTGLAVALLTCSAVLAQPANAQDHAANLAEAYGPKLREMPDWSGVWSPDDLILFPGRAKSVLMPDPAGDDGGFTYGPLPGSYITGVPYNAEYRAIYDDIIRRGREEFYVDDPVGGCMLPHGMPRVMGGAPGPIEIVQTPKITYLIWDYMNELRRIYTDGRAHPSEDEAWPTVMGHSIGHWEGDTLVVDTVNMMAGQYDRTGAPHSDQVHMMERIRLLDDGRLEDRIVLEDPVAFTEPWEVTRYFRKAEDQMVSVEGTYCDNQRNPHDAFGNQTVTLPGAN